MAHYRICPYCHAYLDAGERCDCRQDPNSQAPGNSQKKTAPSAANTESGKMEIGLPANISTSMIAKNG